MAHKKGKRPRKPKQLTFTTLRGICITPIIVVGMHRSGTTLLADILEHCNVFLGAKQSNHKESLFFQDINRRLLDATGNSWRYLGHFPSPKELRNGLDNEFEWMTSDTLRWMGPTFLNHFWGKDMIPQLLRTEPRWGWKDPRNSLLLPVWKKLFSKAIVVNIYRDGRDVALSLLRREIKQEGGWNSEKKKFNFSRKELERRFFEDLKLWETYTKRIKADLPFFRSYTLKFENLLTQPKFEILKLTKALNLSQKRLPKLVSLVDPSRTKRFEDKKFSWVKDLKIDSPLLKELGYTK